MIKEPILPANARFVLVIFLPVAHHTTHGCILCERNNCVYMIRHHHERWDGRGYPYNIAGENIPLLGRIICVADSFDAMSSTRTYRPALPLETVLGEIQRCAGNQFDPQLARVFVTLDFSAHTKSVEEQLLAARLADTDMSESNQ